MLHLKAMRAIDRGCLAYSLTVCVTVDLVIAQRLRLTYSGTFPLYYISNAIKGLNHFESVLSVN